MNEQRRLLVLGGKFTQDESVLAALRHCFEVDQVGQMDEAMVALRGSDYHAILADVGDFLPLERELVGDKSRMVLDTVGEGVCVVDADGRCSWSNKSMRGFDSSVFEKVIQICSQARLIFTMQTGSQASSKSRSKKFSLHVASNYFEVITSPVIDDKGKVTQVVAVVWDATSGKRLQQKIDAIDSAGRELARIEGDAIAKLAPGERLKLLRDKIIKYSRDLMHFDHFGIRLLDKRANKLEVVISEGLPSEALEIDLYAQPEGNGISGYVASTGRSYICHDTEKDPRYVLGLDHCKSSLTVPLKLFDSVIGVYNIESTNVGAFTEDDRQFAEIFGRYVAMTLNILDLLVVERYTTTGHIADSVVHEMAQPLHDIVTEAQSLMEDYIGEDSMRERLHKIVNNVESIRQAIKDVAAGPKTVLGKDENQEEVKDQLLHGKRILIADDEGSIRKAVTEILGKFGCACEQAKDGFEAVTLLEQQEFDLIVSDIKMPYRNGYEIYAAARRVSEDLPVILMTGFGYDPTHSIVRASQDGLSCVLFKPFKVDQLMEEVRKALDIEQPGPKPEPSEA